MVKAPVVTALAGEVDKKLARPGGAQKSSKKDEEKDKRGRNTERDAENPIGSKVLEGRDLLDGKTAVSQKPREIGPEKGVNDSDDGHDGQRPAHRTACPLKDEKNHGQPQINV